MPDETFGEQLWNGLGDAIGDIREKLVEEPMWGRALSGPEEAPQWPEAREAEPEPQPAEQEHTPEPDIER